MQDWDPTLYRKFDAERTRPAQELLSRIRVEDIRFVTDLGCGPGNSTELLVDAWPQAQITGLDSSAAMLEQARERLPQCAFYRHLAGRDSTAGYLCECLATVAGRPFFALTTSRKSAGTRQCAGRPDA